MKECNFTNLTMQLKSQFELDREELMPLFKFIIFMSMFIVISWTNGFLKMYLYLFTERMKRFNNFFKDYW